MESHPPEKATTKLPSPDTEQGKGSSLQPASEVPNEGSDPAVLPHTDGTVPISGSPQVKARSFLKAGTTKAHEDVPTPTPDLVGMDYSGSVVSASEGSNRLDEGLFEMNMPLYSEQLMPYMTPSAPKSRERETITATGYFILPFC